MKVKYNSTNVSWIYDGNSIEVALDKILHASYRENKNIVIVETGIGFIEECIYYYSVQGELLAQQNLETGEIVWGRNSEHQLSLPYTETVGFYPEDNLILVIYRTSEEKIAVTALKVYDLEGNHVNTVESPEGYTMVYITGVDGNIAKIVCDATIVENIDPYGRDRFNFSLDLSSGEWFKIGLAY